MKAFSRNGSLYLFSGLNIIEPTDEEISSFQFDVQRNAPNDKIMWLAGEFVEGDVPNRNGQMWTSQEISIKSMTARLMPVTVMHDFKTAVGVIADTKLTRLDEVSADGKKKVKLSTVLAIWAHRFPEIAQEIQHNHEMGTLMQSQECDAPSFECSSCGTEFIKPVDDGDLCEHIAMGEASRTLHNVTFTGTGLIFGSRGAEGANPNAQLDLAEVAQWSDARINKTGKRKQETSNVDEITIKRSEYDELKARPSREDFDALKAKADEAEKAQADAEKAQEEAAVAQKAAEDAKAEADKELAELKGEVEADELAKERMEAVDEELAAALPDSIKEKLNKQARSMSDEDWSERLAELSELVKVEPKSNDDGKTFSKDEISRFNGKGRKADTSIDVTSLGKSLYNDATQKA